MSQASQRDPFTGKTVYRWRIESDRGPKVTWAESEQAAREKLEAKGMRVLTIRPADSLMVEGFE